MDVSAVTGSNVSEIEAPFLVEDTVEGHVDYRGRSVKRSKSGGWKSASFIIGVEISERFAYYGISSNLINYLTGPVGQSTAAAAANVSAWFGATSLFPLLGAFLPDSFLGRYRTIIVGSSVYILVENDVKNCGGNGYCHLHSFQLSVVVVTRIRIVTLLWKLSWAVN
ncbi:OLC1v1015771C1 [Oldenlandia corymbosa var. corymbosa]|uniref:OLC1v1015771C1 n=1 Tax=Oldenlandia corymbosa var. corymbosa TaxID=529605 RepID=A0AAV1E6Y5_OLDCO|nr:OLC1v1015771C1 [Oldenlandia corymbosa var. corymbosa]